MNFVNLKQKSEVVYSAVLVLYCACSVQYICNHVYSKNNVQRGREKGSYLVSWSWSGTIMGTKHKEKKANKVSAEDSY